MQSNLKHRRGILPFAALAFGLTAAILRIILVSNKYILSDDTNTSLYYIKFDGVASLFALIVLIACIAAVLAAISAAKRFDVRGSYMTKNAKMLSMFSGACLIVCTAVYLFTQRSSSVMFAVLTAVFAVIAGARLILLPFGKFRMRSDVCAYMSMAAVVYYAIRILSDFVNQTATPLDMSGAYHFIMLISVMLYWVQETRISICKPQNALFLIFGLISLITVPIYALPAVILRFTHGIGTVSQAVISIYDLASCLYILSRMTRCLAERHSEQE